MDRLSRSQRKIVFVLAGLAALLYCSWPLGYVLNHTVSAHHGLASELGALGQPYWWLFNGLDITASILIVIVTVLLWRGMRRRDSWIQLALFSYSLFAVLTALDAILPLHCLPSLNQCPPVFQDPQILAHGIFSIGASILLLVSALSMWRYSLRLHNKKLSMIMVGIMVGWSLFGILSLVFFFYPGPGYLAQHYYITLCSVWIALFPLAILLSVNLIINEDSLAPPVKNQLRA